MNEVYYNFPGNLEFYPKLLKNYCFIIWAINDIDKVLLQSH